MAILRLLGLQRMGAESRIVTWDDRGSLISLARKELRHGALFRKIGNRLVNGLLTQRRAVRSRWLPSLAVLDIEPTSHCNHKCKFCVTGLGINPRPKGRMSLETFKKSVEGVRPGTDICLAGYGEPFLNPDLELFLEYAHEKRLTNHLAIFSNFVPISSGRIRGLLNYPFRSLVISMHSLNRDTFKQYAGCDDFDRVFENISILAEEAKRRKRVCQELIVQMIVTKLNVHEKGAFVETVRRLGLTPVVKTLNTHSSFADDAKIEQFEVMDLSRYKGREYTRSCAWAWGGMTVYWNGDVTVCCQDPNGIEIYGNVNDTSTTELLNSAEGRCDFRKRYFDDPGQIRICHRCDIA